MEFVKKRYAAQLLSHRLRHGGFLSAVGFGLRLARSRLIRERHLVYGFSMAEHDGLSGPSVLGFSVDCHRSSGSVKCRLRAEMAQEKRCVFWSVDELFAAGAVLWAGSLQGEPACLGCSQTGASAAPFFFPLADSWVLLSHFVTFSAFRGRGLYPALLSAIVCALVAQGKDRFFVSCAEWNTASRRGIEKAGFRLMGCGFVKRGGRLIWLPGAKQKEPAAASAVELEACEQGRSLSLPAASLSGK
jgi:RimJ/RimL family protein N-acetyltransferase